MIAELGQASLWTIEKNLQSIANPKFREFIKVGLDKAYTGDFSDLKLATQYKRYPVGVEEFICSKAYLDAGANVWAVVLENIIELNNGEYTEAVLTGGIGVAKTTIAIYTTAYQTYLLSVLKNPHRLYGLDPASEIEFIFQSMTASLAKAVDYARYRSLINKSPYFRSFFMFNRNVESEMRFPNNILVKPVGGTAAGAIGQNVMGGVIDEMNFMAVIQNSKQSVDKGTYDQAVAVYDSLSRRRKSRFMKLGKMPGILCLVSSKRYPGQFTDKKVEEAIAEKVKTGKSTMFVYDKTSWEVKPKGSYSGVFFNVYRGSESNKAAIIEGDISSYAEGEIVKVPEEYRSEFERDLMGALRDIAGVSTLARYPFILDPSSVSRCMSPRKSIFNVPTVDFVETQLMVMQNAFTNKQFPRFAHLDLAVTGDSAGLAIGYVDKFIKIDRGNGQVEVLPRVVIDGVLEIKPPKNGEILFHKIRSILYAITKMGINLKWVTFDSFQSVDSMQLLRQKGYTVGYTSVDTSMLPYEVTKTALYDKRVNIPKHIKLQSEFVALEKDIKRGKIDHPPNGSKDLADALTSVVYGLTYRRDIWASFGIPITSSTEQMVKVDKHMRAGDSNDTSKTEL